jgi:hypothetical protein
MRLIYTRFITIAALAGPLAGPGSVRASNWRRRWVRRCWPY